MEDKILGDDLPLPANSLFARLAQIPHYTWDSSITLVHSSYDHWHAYGILHNADVETPATATTSSFTYTTKSSVSSRGSPKISARPHMRQHWSSISGASTASEISYSRADPEQIWTPVVARISTHTLRLEREYNYFKSIIRDCDPQRDHSPRPIELVRFPATSENASPMIACIYEAEGANYLSDILQSGSGPRHPATISVQTDADRTPSEQLGLQSFLDFAIGSCETVELLHHGAHMVHGEIRQDTFHWNRDTGKVVLANRGNGPRAFENVLSSEGWASLSKDRDVKDKLAYIAPEQTGRLPADPDTRTDIYSLGMLFWTMLMGLQAFDAESPIDMIQKVLSGRLPPVSSRRMDVPDTLSHIIVKMTQKQMDERYKSASGLKYDLMQLQKLLGEGELSKIQDYKIGQRDVSSAFILPSKLFGRHSESERITKIIDKVHKRNLLIVRKSQVNNATASNSSISDYGTGVLDILDRSESSSSLSVRDSRSNSTALGVDSTVTSIRQGYYVGRSIPDPRSASTDFSDRDSSLSGSFAVVPADSLGPIGRRRNSHKFKKRSRTDMILLCGSHGVGKTALLKSIQPHVRRHGYLALTTFDRARPCPYERLIKAMASLFRQIFSERDVTTPYHEMVRLHTRSIWPSLHQLLDLPESLLDSAATTKKVNNSNEVYTSNVKEDHTPPETKAINNGPSNHSIRDANDFLRGPSSTKTIRLMNTFMDLLRVMTTGKLICICLDDLHAAEDESLDLTFNILKAKIPVLFLAASRSEDSDDIPEKMKPLFHHESVTKIELHDLREKHTFEFVATTMSRSIDEVLPLAAVVYEKSRGNPFMIREVMETCYRRDCLWYDWRSSMWQFDLDKTFNELSSEDTLDGGYLTRKLSELPDVSRAILAWASLIGESFSFKFVQKLLQGKYFFSSHSSSDGVGSRDAACSIRAKKLALTENNCVDGLQQLLNLGILVPSERDDEFKFSHARYLRGARELSECEDETKMHYVIARALMSELSDGKEDLYALSRHICLAADIIKDRVPHRARIRDILWKGAQAATEAGADSTALWYYETSLKLMQDDRWNFDHPDVFYDETLQVCINTAELLVVTRQTEAALALVAETFEHASCSADKTRSYLLKGKILAGGGQFVEAFDELRKCLTGLGVPVRPKTWDECDIEFKQVEYRLRSMKREEIITPILSEDKTVIALGTVLSEALAAVFWSDGRLWYQLSITLVSCLLDRGLFTQAGLGFIVLAVGAMGRFKDAELSLYFIELAKDFNDLFDDPFTRSRGWTLYSIFLSHLHIPVRQTLPILDSALEHALTSGDKLISVLNIGAMASYRFFAGQDLSDIEAFCTFAPEEFEGWESDIRGGTILIAIRQLVKALQGKTMIQSPETLLDDETHSTAKWMRMCSLNKANSVRAHDLYIALTCPAYFIYGYHEYLVDMGMKMIKSTLDELWTNRGAAQLRFYTALSMLQIAKGKQGKERDALVQEARELKKSIDSWSGINDVNYYAWSHIIAAEIGEVTEDCEAAITSSEMATDHCAVHGFALEEAIALELQAESLIAWGGKRAAKSMLQEAITAWNRFSAVGKAKQLSEKHEWLLRTAVTSSTTDAACQTVDIGNIVNHEDPGMHAHRDYTKSWIEPKAVAPITTGSQDLAGLGLDVLDLTSILDFSRVISSELQINALLAKMTEVILESVGGQAEFCAVVIDSVDQGWSVAASGDNENGVNTYPEGIPFTDVDDQVAQHITNYIIRTKETVFLPNVLEDERFSVVSEGYLQRNPNGRSIIAIPIIQADHLMGIIHLEGRPNAFTQRNMVVLNLITTQVSISLGNALLYQKVRKISAANGAIVESQKRALAAAREAEAKAKKAEAEAKHNVKLKEEAAKAKSIFLANVSHELRTPLNGVIGMSELLKGTPLSKDQEGYADSIRVCADTLLTVINDILDFSKLEAGKMQMFAVPLNLKETITEVVRALAYTNQEHGLQTIEALDLDDHLVLGDPVRLHQIFMNLLSNAYKFTPKGSVTVKAEKISESKEKVLVKCSVADTGIGITEEQLSRLFQPFSQADSSTARSYGGSGLGLSICKAIIENVLGGRIWIESTPDVGTTVYFTLSFKVAPKDSSVPQDMEISAKDPDPMANWSQATSPNEEDRKLSMIDLSKKERSDIRICIAEDNQINRKIAISFVRKLGFECEAYEDGKQAYEALQKKSKEDNPFHIVLMDVQMPVLDGYEATKAIRADPDPQVNSVLIIAMTASAIRGDREKCLEAGMNDYLAKPVRQAALKAMLDEYLNNTKAAVLAATRPCDSLVTPGDKANGIKTAQRSHEISARGKFGKGGRPALVHRGSLSRDSSAKRSVSSSRRLNVQEQEGDGAQSPPSGKKATDANGHISTEIANPTNGPQLEANLSAALRELNDQADTH